MAITVEFDEPTHIWRGPKTHRRAVSDAAARGGRRMVDVQPDKPFAPTPEELQSFGEFCEPISARLVTEQTQALRGADAARLSPSVPAQRYQTRDRGQGWHDVVDMAHDGERVVNEHALRLPAAQALIDELRGQDDMSAA